MTNQELHAYTKTKGFAIPDFDIAFSSEKQSAYAVVIPVLNEGMRIRNQLTAMSNLRRSQNVSQYDLVIVDGGSTDGALERSFLEENLVNTLLVKTGEGKLGSQLRLAQAYALARGYEGIVYIDGNNKDGVEAIPLFIEKLASGFDYVQGSRFVPGGVAINTPVLRYLGIKLLHAPMLTFATGFKFTDTTNGFRATSRNLLLSKQANFFRSVFSSYEYHYYIAYSAAKLGFKCVEIPVCRRYPAGEKTPTKITGFRSNFKVLQQLFNVCRGKYGP